MVKNSHPIEPDAVEGILAYHERSKHRPEAYARGPGGLDWANQPNPFRTYEGAPVVRLPLAGDDDTPPAGVLFGAGSVPARPLTLANIGLLLELSLGLSARKEVGGTAWYLRMNPSSGNLHPTEAYAVLPKLTGLPEGAGVYHYAPYHHALELRSRHSAGLSGDSTFWLGLSSVTWREAWKYGERAFRYCQHDTGHALAALRYAAAALGWSVRLVTEGDDNQLARLLGLDRAADFLGAEPETPELLVQMAADDKIDPVGLPPPAGDTGPWFGRANRLSPERLTWSAVEQAVALSERRSGPARRPVESEQLDWLPPTPPVCRHTACQLIRQRRSAVSFDGVTSISREVFLFILDATLPRTGVAPFDVWPDAPRVHLILFVHRVIGLDPGLYVWLRDPSAADSLRRACHEQMEWEPVTGLAAGAPLMRLGSGDLRDFARVVSCHQDIAADSVFSLGMLAQFEPVLRERGAVAYRELFWETGMIGQALYLAAEAAGIRGTGIGCYFDDVLHQALGLKGRDWQSLYHFTVGGPMEDPRLQTVSPYVHLTGDRD